MEPEGHEGSEDGRVRVTVDLQGRHLGAVGVGCEKWAWLDMVLKALMASRWLDETLRVVDGPGEE